MADSPYLDYLKDFYRTTLSPAFDVAAKATEPLSRASQLASIGLRSLTNAFSPTLTPEEVDRYRRDVGLSDEEVNPFDLSGDRLLPSTEGLRFTPEGYKAFAADPTATPSFDLFGS